MSEIITVGLDLAKNVFQVHGADASGLSVLRKKLRRDQVLAFFSHLPPCLVTMEACGGAHFWGREIGKLGHEVRLIPPAYVKPFVKRQKNDAADAEAICEAAMRPTMRFVPVKSEEAQGAALVFRIRELLIRQRTQAINALRGHLGEFGQVVPQGAANAARLIAIVEGTDSGLPADAIATLKVLVEAFTHLETEIGKLDAEITRRAKENDVARRLMTVPGIAACGAAAIIPSRKNAKPWKPDTAGAIARNDILRKSKRVGRTIWRRWSGYHRRSRAETKMHCVKLLGQRLSARDFDRQVAEFQVRVAVLNGFTALGPPNTEVAE